MPNWKSLVVSLEQSEDATRILFVQRNGRVVGAASMSHTAFEPAAGRVELDPRELWYKARKVIASGLDIHRTLPAEIASIGLTAPSATVAVWNVTTGECAGNILGEYDRRGEELPEDIQSRLAALVPERTGLEWSPALPVARLAWHFANVEGASPQAHESDLLYGSIGTWLLWNLTGAHTIDQSTAACSGMWNPRLQDWDDEILSATRLPRSLLPPVVSILRYPSEIQTKPEGPFGGRVPLTALMPGEQAALYGLGCTRDDEIGCAAWIDDRLFLNAGTAIYEEPASAATGGIEATVAAPFLADSILSKLRQASGGKVRVLRISGSRALDDFEMQRVADRIGIPVERMNVDETAAYGAALAAGLAAGFWKNEEEVRAIRQVGRRFEPRISQVT